MSANERQVGGSHYRGKVQHWDFVHAVGLGYHAGNATKYAARYTKKNGLQDLEKALHYIDKCVELEVGCASHANTKKVMAFADDNSLTVLQAMAIDAIMWGDWDQAREYTERMAEPLRTAPQASVMKNAVGDPTEPG